jgi:HAMP domain-containing protein
MAWLGIILAVILVLVMLMKIRSTGHFRVLQRSRPALAKEDYIHQLKDKGHDEALVSVVYDTIMFYLPKWFTPYPEDDIIKTYSIASGDIHRFMQELLRANHHILPADEVMQDIYRKHNERVTVEYLLETIENSRPKEDEEASKD